MGGQVVQVRDDDDNKDDENNDYDHDENHLQLASSREDMLFKSQMLMTIKMTTMMILVIT